MKPPGSVCFPKLILLVGGLLCLPNSLFAQTVPPNPSPIVWEPSTKALQYIGTSLSYLEDPEGAWNLGDIQARQSDFTPLGASLAPFGFSTSAYWNHFTFKNNSNYRGEFYLESLYAFFDKIDFYLIDGTGTLNHLSQGDTRPFSERPIHYRNFIFPFKVAPGETVQIYVRTQARETLRYAYHLWNGRSLVTSAHRELLFFGFFYGLILVVFLYNLVIYFSTRDPSHLYYVIYVLIAGIFSACFQGMAFQYLWPDSPDWHNKTSAVFSSLMNVSLFVFARSYLQTALRTPRLDTLLKIGLTVSGIVTAVCLVGPTSLGLHLGTYNAGFAALIMIGVAIYLCSIRVTAGYFFACSFACPLLGYILMSMMISEGTDSSLTSSIPLFEVFALYGLDIATALQLTILSLGLAEKISTMRKMNETMQEQAFRTQAEAKEKLSFEVALQTAQLRKKGEELKDLNTQLTEGVLKRYLPPTLVEKMLSEGIDLDQAPRKISITVLFSDLCGFTGLTNQLQETKMGEVLNRYLSGMNDVIFEHGGTVDKFIGDAIMVLFGAPIEMTIEERVEKSVACALDMQIKLRELNEAWQDEGIPNLMMRIGIAEGPVVVGNFGGEKRSDYTAIGPIVNLAARIEGACSPGHVFASARICDFLEDHQYEPAGEYTLKGILEETSLYRLIHSQEIETKTDSDEEHLEDLSPAS